MRKGRYKKNFLTPEQCPEFAAAIAPLAQSLLQRREQKEISDPELVAEFILGGIKILRPDSWKGSRFKAGTPTTALETLEIFSLRGLPASAQRALCAWAKGLYPLRLFLDVPTTETVLKLQIQGIRCVTVVLDLASLSQYVLGERDPFSFTLHDLIHADHFFHDPRQTQVQVGFSRWLSELWKQPNLRHRLLETPHFAAQFEYACADMNSHGAHLVKYLKAVFCQNQAQALLFDLALNCELSPGFHEALQVLNTSAENASHLEILEAEFRRKGHSANTQSAFL